MRPEVKRQLQQNRHARLRQKVRGTAARPRMSCAFSNQHIYVQFVDDERGVTLASASTRAKDAPKEPKLAANVKSAEMLGKVAAAAALAAGIRQVIFDRGVHQYHGKVKALADAARQAGLQF